MQIISIIFDFKFTIASDEIIKSLLENYFFLYLKVGLKTKVLSDFDPSCSIT